MRILVTRPALDVREDFQIVDGRMFEWGLNEVVVGVGALLEFEGLEIGSSISVGQEEWPVVGVFEIGVGLTSVGGARSGQTGLAGSFFSGVLATIVATPCTAPFMGAA